MSFLRQAFYFLSPKFRFWIRRIYYFPQDLLKFKSQTVAPPQGLIYTGSGDFVQQGKDWLDFFKLYGFLKKENNFLDIGSGIGRIALPLTTFLTGTYCGFDVVKLGVDWCQENISKKFKNFNFLFVDLFNDLYKSKGENASNFNFPYQNSFFDFSCSISVFTHMIPDEVLPYLKETNRCLKKEGILVATFFILDEESKILMQGKEFNFKHQYGNYALIDSKVKSANVAYQRIYLNSMIEDSGFEIIKEFKGYWCGREKEIPLAFQDILVLRKKLG